MKKVHILAAVFVPADTEGQMTALHPGTVAQVDDKVAGELVASQRARYADEKAKLVDTTKEHEAAAEQRAAESLTPQAMIAAAVVAALAAAQKPAEATKADAQKA